MAAIRVGLISRDNTLQPLLASTLGDEFRFFMESSEPGRRTLLAGDSCDVVILDLNFNLDGNKERIEYATWLIESAVPVLILADDNLRTQAEELVGLGACGYCRRPPSIRDLRAMLREASQVLDVEPESEPEPVKPALVVEPEPTSSGFIGSSASMQRVYQLIDCVSAIDASVLVEGESGTGKELVARAIHEQGPRVRKPFVAVSCGAIPESLIESELFGHEKGAFTGTVGAREGLFEQAGDGTLFLDEIGELTPYTQVKLLRVLQQREFSRLGSNKLIPLRARLIFATHRDLSEMVDQGKFRQDLYYRINVMKIETPSLQDHPEDIPQLATFFMRRYARQFEKPVVRIDADAMAILENYPWPGNVRELENVLQHAIILAEGKAIRADDLPNNLSEESTVGLQECAPDGSFEQLLREFKVRIAENAIREHKGNKTMAARSLSISRAYLHRLVRPTDAAFAAAGELAVMGQRYH
ncbi:MAG TPA: sigma-54 dependent transcriptional regulator [Terracidiphilus sp.]|nr:sigma-54 dependent transcriptional regulator [Terracidiphilus sp.]